MENSRPPADVQASLASRVGLSLDEVQRWFRDRRSMVKRGVVPADEATPSSSTDSLPHSLSSGNTRKRKLTPEPRSKGEHPPTAPTAAQDSLRHTCTTAFASIPPRSRERADTLVDLFNAFTPEDRRAMSRLLTSRTGSANLASASAPARRAKQGAPCLLLVA